MCNRANLKAYTQHLIREVGGVVKAAKICGVPESELSVWQNDRHARFIPIDHLLDLDEAAGDLFLQEYARMRGYQLTPLNAITSADHSIVKVIGQLSKDAGNLNFTALDAASDNHFTPNEKRRIRDDIAPVKDSIAQLERAIS